MTRPGPAQDALLAYRDTPSPLDDLQTLEGVRAVVRGQAHRLLRAHSYLDFHDLCQCGWVGALQAAGRYKPGCGASFVQFARPRIRGAMLDEVRSSRRSVATAPLEDPVADCTAAADSPWDELAGRLDISCAIQQLPLADRSLLHMVYARGYADAKVAGIQGCSPNEVRRRRWQLLRTLRASLDIPAR